MTEVCGRYVLDSPRSEIGEKLGAIDNPAVHAESGTIAPRDRAPVVVPGEQDALLPLSIESYLWDFAPNWMAPSDSTHHNARIERLQESRLWGESFDRRRCIVPMDGYFDWAGVEDKRWARMVGDAGRLLSAAGIFQDGTFAIVVRSGTCADGHLHPSMPLFIPDGWVPSWFGGSGGTSRLDESMFADLIRASEQEDAQRSCQEVLTASVFAPPVETEPDDQEFLRRFEALSLASFSHEDHLRVAFVMLDHWTMNATIGLLRRELAAILNVVPGAPEYHETRTIAWIRLVAQARAGFNGPFSDFLRLYPRLRRTNLLDQYYSAAVLGGAEARHRFVEPDLMALRPVF